MICPNCGRELSDTTRICPGCSSAQRVSRRRHAEVDLPVVEQQVRVERRVQPDEGAVRQKIAQSDDGRSGTVSSPEKKPKKTVVRHDFSGYFCSFFHCF